MARLIYTLDKRAYVNYIKLIVILSHVFFSFLFLFLSVLIVKM